MRRALLACLAILSTLPAAAQAPTPIVPPDIGARVADAYVVPSLAAFSDATERLRVEMNALCAGPGEENLENARTAFAGSVRAWGPVSILRFGPLVEENRFERLFFWPDARGVTLRQVQGVLAAKDADAATPAGLAEKSVALQGLPALEFVLFGSGSEKLARGDQFRCGYGAAISANAVARAAELAAAWAPGAAFHTEFTRPDAANAIYRSPEEVAGEVIKALGTGLQFVRDAELLPALGDSAEKANGKRAPFWRSELSFALVGVQIEGLAELLQAAGFEGRLDDAGRAVVDSVHFELDHALAAINAVEGLPEAAFAEEGDRGRISYVAVTLQGANRRISEQLSAAIGLTMGFNALDGD